MFSSCREKLCELDSITKTLKIFMSSQMIPYLKGFTGSGFDFRPRRSLELHRGVKLYIDTYRSVDYAKIIDKIPSLALGFCD